MAEPSQVVDDALIAFPSNLQPPNIYNDYINSLPCFVLTRTSQLVKLSVAANCWNRSNCRNAGGSPCVHSCGCACARAGSRLWDWLGFFRAWDFGRCCISLLLLADNYSRTTNDLTTGAQSAQRTHRDDTLTKARDHCPAWQFLRATGSSARQFASRIVGGVPVAPHRSLPVGRAVRTMSPFPRRARMREAVFSRGQEAG